MSAPTTPQPLSARRRPPVVTVLGVAGLTLLAACSPAAPAPATPSRTPGSVQASPTATTPATPTEAPSGPPALLLEVRREGGFINPAASIGALPAVVVDADGRIYTPGADGARPLMIPVVLVRATGATGAAAVLAAARAAGLADGGAAGGVVADMGAVVFTLEVDGREVVTRVAANGPDGGPGLHPGPSGEPSRQPGAAALDLLARLVDPATPWAGRAAPTTPYSPVAYQVWVASSPADAPGATAPWPLAEDPATFGTAAAASLGVDGLRSGVVAGDDAVTLGTVLAGVTAGTALSANGVAYRVWIEPLVPADLGG
jgi:hypothetical protein